MIEKLSVWVDEVKDIKATSLAQLAESDEKPKLRHGDYGFAEDGEPRLVFTNWNNNFTTCGNFSIRKYQTQLGKAPKIIIGNIFKELAALKPKKEFEIADVAVSLDKDYVRIEGDGYTVYVGRARFHDFILNLRCMELQMIQDAAKQ